MYFSVMYFVSFDPDQTEDSFGSRPDPLPLGTNRNRYRSSSGASGGSKVFCGLLVATWSFAGVEDEDLDDEGSTH